MPQFVAKTIPLAHPCISLAVTLNAMGESVWVGGSRPIRVQAPSSPEGLPR